MKQALVLLGILLVIEIQKLFVLFIVVAIGLFYDAGRDFAVLQLQHRVPCRGKNQLQGLLQDIVDLLGRFLVDFNNLSDAQAK